MRELKFRAWDNKRNRYVGDGEIVFKSYENETTVVICPNSQDYIGDICHDEYADDGRFVVEQYTGLKDKNGKEIYEGDVIRWSDDYDENGYIDFSDGCFLVNWPINSERINCDMVDDLEVIGNIHENPELIKEEE